MPTTRTRHPMDYNQLVISSMERNQLDLAIKKKKKFNGKKILKNFFFFFNVLQIEWHPKKEERE
jgi:hypothetical protein